MKVNEYYRERAFRALISIRVRCLTYVREAWDLSSLPDLDLESPIPGIFPVIVKKVAKKEGKACTALAVMDYLGDRIEGNPVKVAKALVQGKRVYIVDDKVTL